MCNMTNSLKELCEGGLIWSKSQYSEPKSVPSRNSLECCLWQEYQPDWSVLFEVTAVRVLLHPRVHMLHKHTKDGCVSKAKTFFDCSCNLVFGG